MIDRPRLGNGPWSARDEGLLLILSGGLSRRMGQPKALLPLYPGAAETFLGRLERLTEDVGVRRALVSSLPALSLTTRLPTVFQPRPEEGQLSSLLLAWETLGQQADWVMMLLVDHPYVRFETLRLLLTAREEQPNRRLWTPSYEGKAGHPVIFSAALMRQLRESPLGDGARPVVRRNAEHRCWVNVEDPAVLWDVDTPEAYADLSARFLESDPDALGGPEGR